MPPMSARSLASAALQEWQTSERFADSIIQDLLERNALSSPDRAFARELFYGVLRNLSLLDFWIDILRDGKLDAGSRDLLRLGLYQLFILRTPGHAAIYETVHLAHTRQRGLINAVLRAAQRQHHSLGEKAADATPAVRLSHPEFLVERWTKQFGSETAIDLCQWNNRPAPIYARINELKTSRRDFLEQFSDARPLPSDEEFVEFDHLPREALEGGFCYIQDPGTGLAVRLLDPQPDETILDACAAPGGKTGLIAQRMQNHGTIRASDRDAARLERLTENMRNLGVTIASTSQHDWITGDDDQRFDRILLDAPCSNTGVMRRRIDVRWRLQPADFPRMQRQQIALAHALIPSLKPGGVFVYSTCSLEPEENEEVAAQIAAEFPALQLIEQAAITPFREGFDGAFAARFENVR